MASRPREPKKPGTRKDGLPDGRGRSEGSRAGHFSQDDGRRRPGRPKGAQNKKTKRREVLSMPVKVTINGKTKTVDTETALYMAQRKKALDGEQRSTELLLGKPDPEPPPPDIDLKALFAEDLAIIEDVRRRGFFDSVAPLLTPPAAPDPAQPSEPDKEDD
jgi:hypothetical protein